MTWFRRALSSGRTCTRRVQYVMVGDAMLTCTLEGQGLRVGTEVAPLEVGAFTGINLDRGHRGRAVQYSLPLAPSTCTVPRFTSYNTSRYLTVHTPGIQAYSACVTESDVTGGINPCQAGEETGPSNLQEAHETRTSRLSLSRPVEQVNNSISALCVNHFSWKVGENHRLLPLTINNNRSFRTF